MKEKDQISTLSLLQLLSSGQLDASRGQFYNDACFVITDTRIAEMEEGKHMFRYPTRLDCFVIMLNEKGKVKLNYNLEQVTIGPLTAFVAAPDSIVQIVDIQDSLPSVIMFSEDFMRSINISIRNLLPHLTSLHKIDMLPLSQEHFDYLKRHIGLVADSIAMPTDLAYYDEVVHDNLRAMAYSFISLLIRHLQESGRQPDKAMHSHEEELFRRFIQLVGQHYRSKRQITFYAGQMHLTPKYMSNVIRRISGHGPADWITQNVLLEAKNLLRYSPMNIQEVAYTLNFPNQSFFGRWFKKHTGLSPKAYRENK